MRGGAELRLADSRSDERVSIFDDIGGDGQKKGRIKAVKKKVCMWCAVRASFALFLFTFFLKSYSPHHNVHKGLASRSHTKRTRNGIN